MCLIALGLKQVPGAAVVVAANREEEFARQATPPQIQSGSPRVICGTDLLAGGTWLGVNQHGLLAAVTNRRKTQLPSDPRSRGKLCRDLLAIDTAEQAASLAWDELASERYAGVNVVCADAGRAYCLHGGDRLEVREMSDGWFVLTNGALDDPQDLRLSRARRLLTAEPAPNSIASFVERAEQVCRTPSGAAGEPAILLRSGNRGTVSSSVVVLADDPRQSIYLHAAGPPDQTEYEDYSQELREMLVFRPVQPD